MSLETGCCRALGLKPRSDCALRRTRHGAGTELVHFERRPASSRRVASRNAALPTAMQWRDFLMYKCL